MSDIVLVALIGAVASTLAALLALAGILVSLKNKAKLAEVAKSVDGKLTAIMEGAKAVGKAEGKAEEKAKNGS